MLIHRGFIRRGFHKKLRRHTASTPREALAESAQRAKLVYKAEGRYTKQINQGILDAIKKNKTKYPTIFNK